VKVSILDRTPGRGNRSELWRLLFAKKNLTTILWKTEDEVMQNLWKTYKDITDTKT